MSSVLNLTALQAAPLKTEPFPFFTVERCISDAMLSRVIADFPEIGEGGSFNVDDVAVNDDFKAFLDAIDSPHFRQII